MLYFIINVICSILSTTLLTIFCNLVKHGYDFYIPILLFIAFLVGYVILTFLILFAMAIPVRKKTEFNQKDSRFYRFVMEHTFSYLDLLGRVKIHFEGKEKINKNQRVVFVCNHKSKFDPIVVSDKLKGYKISWVAKKSLFKMPLVNRYMYKSNFLPLDRKDLKQGLRVIKQAVTYLNEDQCSIGVFPEGTRNTTEDVLLPFKSGSFKISLLSKTDIVVVAIANTEYVAKRFPFRSTNVYVRVCKVIKYDDVKDLPSYEIADMVSKIIEENVIDLRKRKI